jgi:hypothetical protein
MDWQNCYENGYVTKQSTDLMHFQQKIPMTFCSVIEKNKTKVGRTKDNEHP